MDRYNPMGSDTAVVLQDKEIVMGRYIEADKLIRKYIDTDIEKFSNSDVKIVLENLKQNILKAPSIDIVRCGECKKRKKNKFCLEHMRYEKDDNNFCSYGERREQ